MIKEPFYGLFLLGLNRRFVTDVPTACVARRGIDVELLINQNYWNSLEDKYQQSLLLHELHHILYKHLWMVDDFSDADKFNYAADLHVNSFIQDVHPDWIYPERFGLQKEMGTKWYYENLPENITQESREGSDQHNWKDFSNLSEAEKKLISNQIDYQAKTAAETAMKSCGHTPGHLSEYLEGLFKTRDAVFNWKGYFKRVLGNSIKSYIKSTRYRPSRFFKDQPGITLKFKPKILVAIDTSGSVSKKELEEFFTELRHVYKSGVYIEVVEFDTQIQNKFVYKGKETDIKIVGRGGTDVTDVYNYYIANPNFSTLVVFTDGYLNVDYPKHRNMIWVISSNGCVQDYPGIAIYIPKEK